jgi:transposase
MQRVFLSSAEHDRLRTMLRKGTEKARVLGHARILLALARGDAPEQSAHHNFVSKKTISRIIGRYETGGLTRALYDLPRSGQPKKLSEKHEAFIVAKVCTDAPEGHAHWTLHALKKALIEAYADIGSVSHECIRHALITAAIKPWREKNVEDPVRVVRPDAHA